jgi:hypothetical protein
MRLLAMKNMVNYEVIIKITSISINRTHKTQIKALLTY